MSAQEPFNRSAEEFSTALPSPPAEVSQQFTIDYNPDPEFAVESHGDELPVVPPHPPMKVSISLLIAIAATLTISTAAFTADLAQLAQVLNISIPQIQAE